jgi:probable HAF family extracellular repeat protein
MTNIPLRLTLLATALTLNCASAFAGKPITYSYTTFAVPNSLNITVVGINASGVVVGNWYDQNYTTHGFTFQNGIVTSVDDPNQVNGTQINGINKRGQIVGYYLDASYVPHAFIYAPATTTFTDVAYPGATNGTSLSAIDTKGEMFGVASGADNVQTVFSHRGKAFTMLPIGNSPVILGVSDNGNLAGTNFLAYPTPFTGFIYSGGVTTAIPTPAGTGNTEAYSINSSGTAVGFAYGLTTANQASGFIFSGGTLTAVNVPGPNGAKGTELLGINDAGICIGISTDASYTSHNFLYSPSTGVYVALAVPNGSYAAVSAMNNAAQVVGTYYDANFNQGGFIATPSRS